MSNGQFISIKLLVIAVISFLGWLGMAATAFVHSALVGNWPEWARLESIISATVGQLPLYWWVAGIFSLVLIYVSTTSMFLAFGLWLPLYPKRSWYAMMISFGHVIILVWDAKNGWAYRDWWMAYAYFVSVVIVVGSTYSLWKAIVSGCLRGGLLASAVFLWLVYVVPTVALYIKVAPAGYTPAALVVLGASMLIVPLASTAMAPLALASHRHA